MKTLKTKGAIGALALGSLALTGFAGISSAHANDATALTSLTTQVHATVSGKDYEKKEGGYYKGSDLLVQDTASGVYQLDEAKYQELSSKGRQALVSDIHDAAQATKSDPANANSGITNNTISNWYNSLSEINGFGSQLMAKMMEDTRPDFNKGAMIYAPFAGPISTIMGFLSILMFGLLGLTVVLDLLYIVVPAVRLAFGTGESNSGGNGKDSKSINMSKIISHAARYAVSQEEGSDDGGSGKAEGSGKSAIWIYITKSFVKFLMVGLALVYLVSGQLWYFVGWMLDLVAGILNF